jgi:hypothetical protein
MTKPFNFTTEVIDRQTHTHFLSEKLLIFDRYGFCRTLLGRIATTGFRLGRNITSFGRSLPVVFYLKNLGAEVMAETTFNAQILVDYGFHRRLPFVKRGSLRGNSIHPVVKIKARHTGLV